MKTSIIYHSYSGNTRSVAERVSASCGGNLVEVKSEQYPSTIAIYAIGCYRAIRGLSDPIAPERIDVSSDDVIVIGTPVWAGRPTPAINAAVASLQGCAGKKAVIFATCRGNVGETLPHLRAALGTRGVTVVGEFAYDRNTVQDAGRIDALIRAVQAAGSAP